MSSEGPLAQLRDGAKVERVLLCRRVERLTTRTGQPYLRLELADRSGAVRAYLFGSAAERGAGLRSGLAVSVRGSYTVHPTFGPQLKLESVEPAAPGSYNPAELERCSPADLARLEARFWELVEAIGNDHLRRLVETVLDPQGEVWAAFREAPAAKQNHQPYRHGLLEHTVSVAAGVEAIANAEAGIDRDLALAGALLHDIGKVDAYRLEEGVAELTDSGRLQGEIPLGYYRVRRAIEELPGFPPPLAEALLHIILSHHGALEHGSPVVPATREAILVHALDNLNAKLGGFDRLLEQLPAGTVWSGFDRALGTSVYLAGQTAAGAAKNP